MTLVAYGLKAKGKDLPGAGDEGTGARERYSCTQFFTSKEDADG